MLLNFCTRQFNAIKSNIQIESIKRIWKVKFGVEIEMEIIRIREL